MNSDLVMYDHYLVPLDTENKKETWKLFHIGFLIARLTHNENDARLFNSRCQSTVIAEGRFRNSTRDDYFGTTEIIYACRV